MNQLEEIDELEGAINNYSIDMNDEYQRLKMLSEKQEYSKGGNNYYGYYSPTDLDEWLNVGNYVRGKLYSIEPKNYDFVYHYKNNRLIMVERYSENKLHWLYFYYYNESSTIILGYIVNVVQLHSIAKCEFDDKCRQIRFLEARASVSGRKLEHYRQELIYQYNETDFLIIRNEYNLYNRFHSKDVLINSKEYSFPISVLDKRKETKKLAKIADEEVFTFLYKKSTDIISNWQVKNGYVVSILLKGVNNIELSYNEETDKNQGMDSEERWNIAFWQQDIVGFVLDTTEEKEFFLNWMEYVDYKKDKIYSITDLIENILFHKVLLKVLNQIHKDDLIKKVFGKAVSIIIHNLDYCDCSVQLTRKANKNKELIKDFEDWIKPDF